MSEETSNQFSSDLCLLILRVSAGFLMIHHGFEKLQDPVGFTSFIVDQYFSFLPFDHVLTPPLVCTFYVVNLAFF